MSILIITLILVVVSAWPSCSAGRFGQVETYSISTRELPNVAADLGTPDTDRARR